MANCECHNQMVSSPQNSVVSQFLQPISQGSNGTVEVVEQHAHWRQHRLPCVAHETLDPQWPREGGLDTTERNGGSLHHVFLGEWKPEKKHVGPCFLSFQNQLRVKTLCIEWLKTLSKSKFWVCIWKGLSHCPCSRQRLWIPFKLTNVVSGIREPCQLLIRLVFWVTFCLPSPLLISCQLDKKKNYCCFWI